jgi:phosphate transport system substrate-binding protein
MAYYEHNQNKRKRVAIDDEKPENGNGPILPTYENVVNGTYQPLSRRIFIYASTKAVTRRR